MLKLPWLSQCTDHLMFQNDVEIGWWSQKMAPPALPLFRVVLKISTRVSHHCVVLAWWLYNQVVRLMHKMCGIDGNISCLNSFVSGFRFTSISSAAQDALKLHNDFCLACRHSANPWWRGGVSIHLQSKYRGEVRLECFDGSQTVRTNMRCMLVGSGDKFATPDEVGMDPKPLFAINRAVVGAWHQFQWLHNNSSVIFLVLLLLWGAIR